MLTGHLDRLGLLGPVVTASPTSAYKPTNALTLSYHRTFHPAPHEETNHNPTPPHDKLTILSCTHHSACHLTEASCPNTNPPPEQEYKLHISCSELPPKQEAKLLMGRLTARKPLQCTTRKVS